MLFLRQMEPNSLTPSNVLARCEQYIAAIPPYPGGYSGKGIIICGGGAKYFPGAWVCVRMLRQVGCTLPVQIWYMGDNEMNEAMRDLVAPYDVECVDALQVKGIKSLRNLGGWQLKAHSVLACRFREVLLLDADNMPVVDPTYLFDTLQYQRTGAIFWPDVERFSDIEPIYRPEIWKMLGIKLPVGQPEFESGQIVINKEQNWRPLNLAVWFNEFCEFFYKYVYGDKDTFHLAWRKLQVSFAMPSRPIHWLPSTMCQHDFGGNRIFQHRNRAKWELRRNRALPGFWFESDCLIYLWELADQWDGRIGAVPRLVLNNYTPERVNIAVRRLLAVPWLYDLGRGGQRLMTFMPDGTIDQGSKSLETFWDIREEINDLYLYISSAVEITCKMRNSVNGDWMGNFMIHERGPAILRLL